MRGLVWFKKDLRIDDNPALHYAQQGCHDGVIAVYVVNPGMWTAHHISLTQIEFIRLGLLALSTSLAKLNIPLLIETVTHTQQVAQQLLTIATQHNVSNLYFNIEHEVDEVRRDAAVSACFTKSKLVVNSYTDQLILPYAKVQTQQGGYFKVFTAFKKQWLNVYRMLDAQKAFPKAKAQAPLPIMSSIIPDSFSAKPSVDMSLWFAGEREAQQRLKRFTTAKLFSYATERDFPAADMTSHLSPYLAVGMISVKTCFLAALAANNGELDTGNPGALTWMSELIWREFYRHVLIQVPRVCMNKAYNHKTEALPWGYNQTLLSQWQQGMTGFPIVDAAMRQLNQTGWMHNRLRMVVAMFLSKNLFLDWRLGERYFTEKLIDFDFAANNGGWQWSASTGTDAVPYFRIFSPLSQSTRFDNEGKFIRMYCPELRGLDNRSIHDPYHYAPLLAANSGYPRPIIDYKKSREFAINAFKNLI